jgi:two-component system chemotaxis response regulator CheY
MTDSHNSHLAPAGEYLAPAGAGKDFGPSGAGGQHRVLVVDDATVVRMYYRQILEAAGYQVTEAINGVEGLEKALLAPFDLAIVDVNMPVMDGFTFVRTLRRDPAIHGLPVLMTTTQSQTSDKLAALRAGVNFFLIKPVSAADLALHVAAMLGDTHHE